MLKPLTTATQSIAIGWLLSFSSALAEPNEPRFVSLTLCSDRLLAAIARPEQIQAMSPYSAKPTMMLDWVNTDKPVVKPQLSDLLPYANATILVNEGFYPRLVDRLKQLNFKVIGINDNPQTVEQLFSLITQLGSLTDNADTAARLIAHLKQSSETLSATKNITATPTLAITDNGMANLALPQLRVLFDLLGLSAAQTTKTNRQLSLEQLLLATPAALLLLSDDSGYSDTAQRLSHPLLKRLAHDRIVASAPVKYTYCFDHGVWQGAKILAPQLQSPKH